MPRYVGAQDHQRPVRQVDDIEDAPDQAEPQRDGDVYPTQQKAEDDLLGELAHELSSAAEIAGLARTPGGCRILRLTVRDGRRKDGVVGPVLDLLDDHRLVRLEPTAVALYLA